MQYTSPQPYFFKLPLCFILKILLGIDWNSHNVYLLYIPCRLLHHTTFYVFRFASVAAKDFPFSREESSDHVIIHAHRAMRFYYVQKTILHIDNNKSKTKAKTKTKIIWSLNHMLYHIRMRWIIWLRRSRWGIDFVIKTNQVFYKLKLLYSFIRQIK